MSRELVWKGSSKKDFSKFPEKIKQKMDAALFSARAGGKAEHAKPLQGFSGAGVLEIVESDGSGTYRLVYTVNFRSAVYALHAFQKKSHKGISTPKKDIDMIKHRLTQAAEQDAEIMARVKKGMKKDD